MAMNPRLLRPLATGFDPRRISSLAAWYDASDTATLGNLSTGPGGVTDNGPVRFFGDKSGNGRHAIQAGADSVCPTFLASGRNGLAGLSFDGGDTLETGTISVAYTEVTLFTVVRFVNAMPNFGRGFTMRAAGSDTQATNVIPAIKINSLQMGAYQGSIRAGISVTDGEEFVWMCRHLGLSLQNRKNNSGETTSTGMSQLSFTATSFAMGRDSMQGRIYEALFFTRAVTDAERDTVAAYLGKKWGITVS